RLSTCKSPLGILRPPPPTFPAKVYRLHLAPLFGLQLPAPDHDACRVGKLACGHLLLDALIYLFFGWNRRRLAKHGVQAITARLQRIVAKEFRYLLSVIFISRRRLNSAYEVGAFLADLQLGHFDRLRCAKLIVVDLADSHPALQVVIQNLFAA